MSTALSRDRLLLTGAAKDPDAWWTVLVVDPVALRVLPHLVDRRRITPDGLSVLSLAFAVAAGACFLGDVWVVGALLFELHFVLDCLDGKLARVRGVQSPRGAFVDLACDLVGTSWCFAALGVAAFGGTRFAPVALLASVAYLAYTWSTLYRGHAGGLAPGRPRAGGPIGRFLARHRMVPMPYGVEVENVALCVLPLLGREDWARWALLTAGGFFVVAAARNVRATYRALGGAVRAERVGA